MDAKGDGDYRQGLFWLISGGGFAVMGLAGVEWLGIQRWYLYTLGVGLVLVAVIVAPHRIPTRDQWRRGLVTIVVALLVNVVVVVASDEIDFPGIFPLILGLLWMVLGIWLMLRPDPTTGGTGQ